MPKVQPHVRLRVKICYHIGINDDFSEEMLIIEHRMQSIPLCYVEEAEQEIHKSIQKLLGNFNSSFDPGIFRLSFHCKRKEVLLRKGKHHASHHKHHKKRLALIRRRVARITKNTEQAIIVFFTLARRKLGHISENIALLLDGMKSGSAQAAHDDMLRLLGNMRSGVQVEIESKL
ncbi:MAG: hypothetical protein PHT88_00380 [Candidatus Moranbacteria bacterium]|nr:hypothetical protein [Candidatus Moranbacteria bacterium]